jgi:ArsR family transcriptional regulator, arsenate/arsenite/antimonite-responsive transcriptional repressor
MEKIDYKKTSDHLKALAHPIRLMIIRELLGGRKCVRGIEEIIKAKQANISQHLAILRYNGVVDYHVQGKKKCYFLKNPGFMKKCCKHFFLLEDKHQQA